MRAVDFVLQKRGEINIKTARICGLHFVKEDFENNMKFEMVKHHLKPDAVPTVYSEAQINESTDQVNELLEVAVELSENKADEGIENGFKEDIQKAQQPEVDEITHQEYKLLKIALNLESDTPISSNKTVNSYNYLLCKRLKLMS